MKRLASVFCALCLCMLLCAAWVPPAYAAAEDQQIPWLTYTLEVLNCTDQPENIEGNPVPVDERYFVITFGAADDGILIMDIVENIAMFSVLDPDGNAYVAAAYFPHSMVFLSAPGVFSTAQMQGKFDVLFVVPKDVPADALTLNVEQTPGGERTSLALVDIVTSVDDAGK